MLTRNKKNKHNSVYLWDELPNILDKLHEWITAYTTALSFTLFPITGKERVARLQRHLRQLDSRTNPLEKQELFLIIIHRLIESHSKELVRVVLTQIQMILAPEQQLNSTKRLKAWLQESYPITDQMAYGLFCGNYQNASYQLQNIPFLSLSTALTQAVRRDNMTLLESGGFANIYLLEWGHYKLAIKMLNEERTTNKTAQAFFEHEKAIHQTLSHPHIVSYLHSSVDYLAIEYLPCGDLVSYQHSITQTKQYVELFTGITSALVYLHNTMEIAHLDIKPDNILIHVKNNMILAKLCDFGLSITFDALIVSKHGSPIYMPPEISSASKQNSVNVNGAMDIYSLGVTLSKTVKITDDTILVSCRDQSPENRPTAQVLHQFFSGFFNRHQPASTAHQLNDSDESYERIESNFLCSTSSL